MNETAARITFALAERYRIERELGAGGMATVYLAEDVKHHRKVAIKVLHAALTAVLGPERFLKEIDLTANLQHPHILPLFDSGSADGLLYYVMPYVSGESLRSRLDRERQLPITDAVRISTEVADALEYAHRHGVIHRDIKPENILLHEGRALVADFGIALAIEEAGGERMTQTGLSIGTPQYMSPEQAMGERIVDARADIYALGVVTYEMLAGEPPFTGPSAQAVVAKVITERPPHVRVHRETVPPAVDAAIAVALQKLPADRFSAAAKFAEAMAAPSPAATSAETPLEVPTSARARSLPAVARQPIALGALGVLAAAALLGAGMWFGARRASRDSGDAAPPSRLAILTPDLGGSGVGSMYRQLTLTPDGSSVIYVAQAGGATVGAPTTSVLLLRALDAESSRLIPNTSLSYAPAVSPDGQRIAARGMTGGITIIPAAGAAPPTTLRSSGLAFYAWGPDGSLWFTFDPFDAVQHMRPGSDSVEVALQHVSHTVWLQQVLDDGHTAIVTEASSGNAFGACALLDLRSGALTTVAPTPIAAARYAAGFLIRLLPDGTLTAQAFDPSSHKLSGEALAIASGVSVTFGGDAQFDVARNGTVVYVPEEPRSLVFVDRSGAERLATQERHSFHMPRFAPDGGRVSADFVDADGRDAWILDLAQQTLSRATFDHDGHDANWAPDGKSLIYTSVRSGVLGIYRIRPGSSAPAESLLATQSLSFTGQWLPDMSGLITVATNLRGASVADIALVRNGGRGPIVPVVASRYTENYPAVSADGRWLAYSSDASGKAEVYVHSLGGAGDEVQVSQGGGSEAVWSRDGRELFYRTESERQPKLIALGVATSPTFRVVTRRALFPIGEYLSSIPHSNYDVSPDGKSFVFVRRNPASRIVVIQNLPALMQHLRSTERAGAQ